MANAWQMHGSVPGILHAFFMHSANALQRMADAWQTHGGRINPFIPYLVPINRKISQVYPFCDSKIGIDVRVIKADYLIHV